MTVIWGTRDRLVPRSHMAGVERAFPQLVAHLWPDMGHHPQCERPQELAAAIEEACAQATATTPLRAVA